jgi:DNA-binding SARP family transcriptional activator/nucleotide-binding universal stress UspA family protein
MIRGRATESLPKGYGPRVLDFRILGPLEVERDGGLVPLGAPKQRAVLAILLLSPNRIISVERFAHDLYAGAPPVTAVTQVQRQISELRKVLGPADSIETRAPGYMIRLEPEQLDLRRFERLAGEGGDALARGDARAAGELYAAALALWRGAPLADLASELFVERVATRLVELRLAVLEQRIEAELALGQHEALVGELEALVAAYPLREQLRAKLMLALYRSGRQAEALEAFRQGRNALVDDLGLEPTASLRELEHAILVHDPELEAGRRPGAIGLADSDRAVLVLPSSVEGIDGLLAVAGPLAGRAGRELIVACLVRTSGELAAVSSELEARSSSFPAATRTAAFTTGDLSGDALRLVGNHNVDLVLLDAPHGIDSDRLPGELSTILERSPADVVIASGPSVDPQSRAGVFVPFGGGEHEWAALELGASLAAAAGLPLRLVGTEADPALERRDASRLLADASLAVQRVAGVAGAPILADASEDGLLAAVGPASVVVAGIGPRWRQEGIGSTRRALVRNATSPVLLVHRGLRPGSLAPRTAISSFTWSVGGEGQVQGDSLRTM